MKINVKRKIVIIVLFVVILCWGAMTSIDYALCQKAKSPVFSISIPVTDQSLYRGLGYTIALRYEDPIGMQGEQLQGYFYWGWL